MWSSKTVLRSGGSSPKPKGMKEFTASGVVFSGLSGANAYIDTVEAGRTCWSTTRCVRDGVEEKEGRGGRDTYVNHGPSQARSCLEDTTRQSVSDKVMTCVRCMKDEEGAVKAKFSGEGKCRHLAR